MSRFVWAALAALFVAGLSVPADAGRVYLPYRCTDSNGDPLSGCRAVSYEAGTSTPYQLFKDAALTDPHGDYVTADGSGFFPDAYSADDQCVDIDFTKSDGSTVVAQMDDQCPTLSSTEITGLFSGTAANENVATSGDALCLLNTSCTWSAKQTFTASETVEFNSTGTGATAGPIITSARDSTSPAADDLLAEYSFDGKDDGTGDVEYGSIRCAISDPSDIEEDGYCELTAIVAGTKTTGLQLGVFDSSDTSVKGANLASGWTYYVDGFPAPGTPLAVVEDQKASGTDGGTCTTATDETRDLNTEVFDPYSLVSISSNQITLQPGTYFIKWSVPAYKVDGFQSFLYDITNSAEKKRGTTENVENLTGDSANIGLITRSFGAYRFTIATATTYEIRMNCETTHSTDGMGHANSFGAEVYTRVEIFAG